MKTFTSTTALVAFATAALLSVGVASASAQEFTLPNGAFENQATTPAARAGGEYTAIFQGRSAATDASQGAWGHAGGVPVRDR